MCFHKKCSLRFLVIVRSSAKLLTITRKLLVSTEWIFSLTRFCKKISHTIWTNMSCMFSERQFQDSFKNDDTFCSMRIDNSPCISSIYLSIVLVLTYEKVDTQVFKELWLHPAGKQCNQCWWGGRPWQPRWDCFDRDLLRCHCKRPLTCHYKDVLFLFLEKTRAAVNSPLQTLMNCINI